MAREGLVDGVTSNELLRELELTLRSKLGFSEERITTSLAYVTGILRVVAVPDSLSGVISDPKDDKVLECAVAADAGWIVTGDRRHLLPIGSYQGITILTPAAFLASVLPFEKSNI
jgi:uncharacterized protein